MRKRFFLCSIILLISVFFALFAGNSAVSSLDILSVLSGGGTAAQRLIFFHVRLPRILASLFAGAALSVSGFLLQNSLNNLIASPGLLGINHGSGLFVLVSALLFPHRYGMKSLFAFAGAVTVALFCYFLSVKTGMSKSTVILSGIAITSACSAATDFIISLKPETVADKVAFQLGGFSSVPVSSVYFSVPVIAVCLVISVITAPVLDLLSLGDEAAHGLGVNIRLYRSVYIICAAVLAGAAVSMCGLIGFVGLIIPNTVRMIFPASGRESLVYVMLLGASFLTFCDTLARILAFPYELPCGLILSCIGAPFLLMILIKKRKRLSVE